MEKTSIINYEAIADKLNDEFKGLNTGIVFLDRAQYIHISCNAHYLKKVEVKEAFYEKLSHTIEKMGLPLPEYNIHKGTFWFKNDKEGL